MPFDLDAVIAEETAKRKPDRRKKFSFEFDGNTFELPNDFIDDTVAMSLALGGDNLGALRRAMKPEDFAVLQQSPKMLTRAALERLLTGYYDHLAGLSLGESVASTSSSRSTAGPSKPTSKSATRKGRSPR